MYKFPLPEDLTIFRPTNKVNSVYEVFYNWVMSKLMPGADVIYGQGKDNCAVLVGLHEQGYDISVSAVRVDTSIQDLLEGYDVEYLRKFQGSSAKAAKQQANFRRFNFGPADLKEKQRKNFIYVEDDFMIKRR